MQKAPRPSDLVSKAGISMSYASEIIGGARTPSRPLAIHIFQTTGWRHKVLYGLSEEEIGLLARIEPYQPREAAAA